MPGGSDAVTHSRTALTLIVIQNEVRQKNSLQVSRSERLQSGLPCLRRRDGPQDLRGSQA